MIEEREGDESGKIGIFERNDSFDDAILSDLVDPDDIGVDEGSHFDQLA